MSKTCILHFTLNESTIERWVGMRSIDRIPCVIAVGMLVKEFGYKKAVALTITSIAYGILIAGLAWRLILSIK